MGTKGYTVFTDLEAANVKATTGFAGALTGNVTGNVIGNVTGNVSGAILGARSVEKAVDYALTATEKAAPFVSGKMTAENKTLTLDLAVGQMIVVCNHGTNSFTVKNVAGDTGTVLAATKALLIVGAAANDGSTVIALN